MRIGIIGAGSVGSAVAVLLQAKGNSIIGIASRTKASAEALAKRLGIKVLSAQEVAKKADVLLITVNDAAIAEVAAQLAQEEAFFSGQVVIHFSGSLAADVLAPAREFGASVVSVHPLQSCAGVERAIKNLPRSVFSIEGDEAAFLVAEKIIRDLEGCFFFIDGKDKMLYHAAAVIISNYTVTLADISKKILQRLSVPPDVGMQGMLTLLKGTLANLQDFGSPQALTGPIARGDVDVVRQHIIQLQEQMPEIVSTYQEMALQTIDVALEKESIAEGQAEVIRNAVKGANLCK